MVNNVHIFLNDIQQLIPTTYTITSRSCRRSVTRHRRHHPHFVPRRLVSSTRQQQRLDGR